MVWSSSAAVFGKAYSPRFAWGGRPHRRFISVRENSCWTYVEPSVQQKNLAQETKTCPYAHFWKMYHWSSLHLYFKQLRSHPQPGPSRATIPPPPGSFQWVLLSLFPPWRLPKLGNFRFPPPWGLPKLGNFHFSPPWQLPKLWNFHFSLPWRLSKLRNFK